MNLTLPRIITLLTLALMLAMANKIVLAQQDQTLNKGKFLVATKALNETSYARTVIYITEHDDNGTYGLIVNKPTEIFMNEILPAPKKESVGSEHLYFGGPMHMKFLFVLAQTKKSEGLHPIQGDIYFGAGQEVVSELSGQIKNIKVRTYAGFSSWGPGQLQQEIDDGGWVVAPGDAKGLFDENTESLWQTLFDRWGGSWI
ncbi:MAG: YqgE/AlgH family protein [Gammaproteobacteria bacterium]|nr:YqgE/AlgH family protein [Gammaproteobacteria bacterium]MDH5727451.1 YqgE/AlgH family protein [Gammaproteobacteria bacterium]